MLETNNHNYWNPYMEKMDRKDLDKYQFFQLKKILSYAYKNSKMYKDLYDSNNLDLDDIKTLNDLYKIPLVNKDLIMNSLKDNQSDDIYGDSLAVSQDAVVYYHQTSGTTDKPIKQPDTYKDWMWWAECWASVLWSFGIRSSDKVLFPFNYNTFIAFWGAHYACEKIGAQIISMGNTPTAVRIKKIFELKITTIILTPSYAFRMVETAKEMGLDLAKSSITKVVLAGEPGGLIEATKKNLETQWGAKVFDHIGATEVGAWGFECPSGNLSMHINEGMFLPEILDLETNLPITEPNKIGRLVITSFMREARPSIRFDTRDLAKWKKGNCSCGRTFRSLDGGVPGRVDHLLKYKGTLITPASIENLIIKYSRCSDEYLVILSDQKVQIQIESLKILSRTEESNIIFELKNELKNLTNLTFDISLLAPNTLNRSETKSKRFIDNRTK